MEGDFGDEASDNFQCAQLVANVRDCIELSAATDKSLKKLPKSPSFDMEFIRQQLKDKSHSEDVEKDLERSIACIETHEKDLTAEIKSRKALIANLKVARKFYDARFRQVKATGTAYRLFTNRLRKVKNKLDEIVPTLSSPIPSPDIKSPSPESDADLQVPDDQSPISFTCNAQKRNRVDSVIEKAMEDLENFKKKQARDEADAFGKRWGMTYLKLETHQKIYAKRLIDAALMYGQLGQLRSASSINIGAEPVEYTTPIIHHMSRPASSLSTMDSSTSSIRHMPSAITITRPVLSFPMESNGVSTFTQMAPRVGHVSHTAAFSPAVSSSTSFDFPQYLSSPVEITTNEIISEPTAQENAFQELFNSFVNTEY